MVHALLRLARPKAKGRPPDRPLSGYRVRRPLRSPNFLALLFGSPFFPRFCLASACDGFSGAPCALSEQGA